MDNTYKVVVVGDYGAGKTSLIQTYIRDTPLINFKPTIGVDFHVHRINETTRLSIWDIAGQERTHNMTRVYYKDAVAAIVVIDSSNLKSVEGAEIWINDIRNKIFITLNSETVDIKRDISITIALAKCDIKNDEVVDAVHRLCEKYECIKILETSALRNEGLEKLFEFVTETIEMDINAINLMADTFELDYHFTNTFTITSNNSRNYIDTSNSKATASGDRKKKCCN